MKEDPWAYPPSNFTQLHGYVEHEPVGPLDFWGDLMVIDNRLPLKVASHFSLEIKVTRFAHPSTGGCRRDPVCDLCLNKPDMLELLGA